MEYFITKEKLKELEKEYNELKEIVKTEISGDAPVLLEGSDLNPEFASFEEKLSNNTNRLEEIEMILKNHKLISKPPASERNKVFLGANVVLKNDKHKAEYRIVGTLEANPFEGKISNESPVGKAFIGKTVGDTISVGPANSVYKILEVNYEDV
jgi:transcription elongation factor GreA